MSEIRTAKDLIDAFEAAEPIPGCETPDEMKKLFQAIDDIRNLLGRLNSQTDVVIILDMLTPEDVYEHGAVLRRDLETIVTTQRERKEMNDQESGDNSADDADIKTMVAVALAEQRLDALSQKALARYLASNNRELGEV